MIALRLTERRKSIASLLNAVRFFFSTGGAVSLLQFSEGRDPRLFVERDSHSLQESCLGFGTRSEIKKLLLDLGSEFFRRLQGLDARAKVAIVQNHHTFQFVELRGFFWMSVSNFCAQFFGRSYPSESNAERLCAISCSSQLNPQRGGLPRRWAAPVRGCRLRDCAALPVHASDEKRYRHRDHRQQDQTTSQVAHPARSTTRGIHPCPS